MFLLLLALLQTPDDLGTFLAQLDKDRAAGTAPAELLGRIDAWAKGRPPDVLARLAWNRALLESIQRIDPLRAEWLKRHVGKSATVAGVTGTVREVKPDAIVLDVSGEAKEIRIAALAPDDVLGDLAKEELLPPKSVDEAVLRFAAGKADIGLALARKLEAQAQDRILGAFVGREIQNADRDIAQGKTRAAAERLAAGWTRHPDLVAAGKGALSQFIETEFLEKLYQEVDKIAAKDRKAARKLLDLVPALSKARYVLEDLDRRQWTLVERNQWQSLRLECLPPGPATLTGSTLTLEHKDGTDLTTLVLNQLQGPWKEMSGFRAKIRVGTIKYVDMRLGFEIPAKEHAVAVDMEESKALYSYFLSRTNPTEKEIKPIAKRLEYEFRFEFTKDVWKASVDNIVIKMFKAAEAPTQIAFVCRIGKCELLSLDVQKK